MGNFKIAQPNGVTRLVHTERGYNFFKGINKDGRAVYNILPHKEPHPTCVAGYFNAYPILKVKGFSIDRIINKDNSSSPDPKTIVKYFGE